MSSEEKYARAWFMITTNNAHEAEVEHLIKLTAKECITMSVSFK